MVDIPSKGPKGHPTRFHNSDLEAGLIQILCRASASEIVSTTLEQKWGNVQADETPNLTKSSSIFGGGHAARDPPNDRRELVELDETRSGESFKSRQTISIVWNFPRRSHRIPNFFVSDRRL
ncbi:hypothetical protein MJO29_007567 [Puccinia striiformis f. sp. tritici]|nr:hypothetical protein MJO29_007567 [Puccinia striiformis f. sp. tritici]